PGFTYLGIVPSQEFYRLTDIVVVPSLDQSRGGGETGSISTLEAMACGKAVIASDISPMNEYIDHGISGLLAKDEEQFYEHCKLLIEDPALARRLGQSAREKAEQYDIKKVFGKLEAIYRSLGPSEQNRG
ncbi:MAG: glycosyltransferase family 4 protein, partial [Chloroflexi bacterium]|nr:glycosyltransferase family 4 protein [Chloroflexota bacterium]